MKIVKINNVPKNIKALVVGQESQAQKITPFLIVALMIAGTVLINYKYATGKI
jgi:hypothetical protein